MSERQRQQEIDNTRSELSIKDQERLDVETKSLEDIATERSNVKTIDNDVELKNPTLDELDFMILDRNIKRVADFIGLGLDEMAGAGEKIEFLMNWAKNKSESNDIGDVVYEIKQLKDSLGFQEIGSTALDRLYQYLRLSGEESQLSKRLDVISKEKEILIDGRRK